MTSSSKSTWDRLQTIDPRVVYGLLIVVLVAPLLMPLGLPIQISPTVQKFYEIIETLKPGDIVFYSLQFGAGDYPEAEGASIAVKRHLFSKDLKIVFSTTNDQAVLVLFKSLESTGIPANKKYGVDWVFLGYVAGAETAIAALAVDMHAACKTDHYGTPLDQIPLMKNVRSYRDVTLLIVEGGGTETPTQFVRQWYAPYRVRYLQICISVVGPTLQPFVNAGQIIAMVVGASGSAEYELLIRRPGIAVAGMDAQAFGHILVIIFIIVGNVAYFAAKSRRR